MYLNFYSFLDFWHLNIIAKTTNHLESICAGFIFVGLMRALMFPDGKKWPGHLRIITTLTCTFGAILLIVNLSLTG